MKSPLSPLLRPRASTTDTPGVYVSMAPIRNASNSVCFFVIVVVVEPKPIFFSPHHQKNHLEEIYPVQHQIHSCPPHWTIQITVSRTHQLMNFYIWQRVAQEVPRTIQN